MVMVMPRPIKSKDGVYWFRKVVPEPLRAEVGKRELKWSLGTKDRTEALTKYPDALAKADRLLEAAKGGVFVLTREQAAGMARRWLEHRLPADHPELSRLVPVGYDEEEDADLEETQAVFDIPFLIADMEKGKEPYWVTEAVEAAIRAEGLPIAAGSASYRLLIDEFFSADILLRRGLEQRSSGDYRPPPGMEKLPPYKPVLAEAAKAAGGLRLSGAYDAWKDEAVPTGHVQLEWDKARKRFTTLHGDKPIKEITRKDMLDFRDNLIAQKLAPATVKKQLGAIRAILEVQVNEGELASNPATKIKVADAVAPEDKRLPLTDTELKAVFAAPVFTQRERPVGGKGEAAYWLPILALFTGARLTELAQLLVEDVKTEASIDYLDINTLGEGKRLKNRGSRRKVPLHPELIRLGFLDYLAKQREAGETRLFPLLVGKRLGESRPAAAWSQWWGRYSRQYGVPATPEKCFHSFRHNFKEAAKVLDEQDSDALTGHKNGSVGRRYGLGGVPLPRLAEAVKKISFGDLGLRP